MKITPCWSVGNWIAASYQCRLQSRLPRVWATSLQLHCPRPSASLQAALPPKRVRVPLAARAAMAVDLTLASPAAALAREKVALTAAAGAVPAKAPAAAAKVSN